MFDGVGNLISWIAEHGSDVVRILILAIVYYLIFRIIVWRIIKAFITKKMISKDKDLVKKRAVTLRDVFLKTGQIFFLIGVLAAVLSEAGVNIAPLLAGFGVVGIAVGFGAQSLIKDIVNGIFIILEGQYSKGDIIEIGEKKGKVEDVNFRKTILRDTDGTVHHIPNSAITIVSNKSQDWADIDLAICVGTKENLGKVITVLERVGKELYKDKIFSNYLLEEPEVLGVENIEDAKVTVKISGRTKHLKKWVVQRELRKRIKDEFDKEKINLV